MTLGSEVNNIVGFNVGVPVGRKLGVDDKNMLGFKLGFEVR